MELGVEPEVNFQTRVNLFISSGMARGFFTTMPTATGSVYKGEKCHEIKLVSMCIYLLILG